MISSTFNYYVPNKVRINCYGKLTIYAWTRLLEHKIAFRRKISFDFHPYVLFAVLFWKRSQQPCLRVLGKEIIMFYYEFYLFVMRHPLY